VGRDGESTARHGSGISARARRLRRDLVRLLAELDG
jgi:hypothetical protein